METGNTAGIYSWCLCERYTQPPPPPTHTLGALRRTALTVKHLSAMSEIKTHKENYKDFYAKHFFALMNTKNVTFEFKKFETKSQATKAIIPVLHVDGMNLNDASRINIDWFPAFNATLSDLEALPQYVDDFMFHIGKTEVEVVDPSTGEITKKTVVSQPKVIGYYDKKGNFVKFNGKKHEWNKSLNGGKGGFEDWENVDDLPKEPEKTADAPAEKTA